MLNVEKIRMLAIMFGKIIETITAELLKFSFFYRDIKKWVWNINP